MNPKSLFFTTALALVLAAPATLVQAQIQPIPSGIPGGVTAGDPGTNTQSSSSSGNQPGGISGAGTPPGLGMPGDPNNSQVGQSSGNSGSPPKGGVGAIGSPGTVPTGGTTSQTGQHQKKQDNAGSLRSGGTSPSQDVSQDPNAAVKDLLGDIADKAKKEKDEGKTTDTALGALSQGLADQKKKEEEEKKKSGLTSVRQDNMNDGGCAKPPCLAEKSNSDLMGPGGKNKTGKKQNVATKQTNATTSVNSNASKPQIKTQTQAAKTEAQVQAPKLQAQKPKAQAQTTTAAAPAPMKVMAPMPMPTQQRH